MTIESAFRDLVETSKYYSQKKQEDGSELTMELEKKDEHNRIKFLIDSISSKKDLLSVIKMMGMNCLRSLAKQKSRARDCSQFGCHKNHGTPQRLPAKKR